MTKQIKSKQRHERMISTSRITSLLQTDIQTLEDIVFERQGSNSGKMQLFPPGEERERVAKSVNNPPS